MWIPLLGTAFASTFCVPLNYNAAGGDCNGGNGTDIFQDVASAYNALPGNGPHTIRMQQGYQDASTIALAGKNVTIQGDGTGASMRRDGGTNGILNATAGTVLVTNVTLITPNNARAVHVNGGSLTLQNVDITREVAIPTSATAVVVTNGTLDLVDVDFQAWQGTGNIGHLSVLAGGTVDITAGSFNNGTGTVAGAINTVGSVTIGGDTRFIQNTASSNDAAGAIRVAGGSLVADGVVFQQNSLTGGNRGGGAITVNGGTLDIANGQFLSNSIPASAARGGGAIYVESHSAFSVTGSTFTSNSSVNTSASGGAIHFNKAGPNPLVSGCTFTTNTSTGDGGAIGLSNDGTNTYALELEGSTFTSNTAAGSGGAVHLANHSLLSMGNVFRTNTAVDGGAISLESGTDASSSIDDTFCDQVASADGGAVWVAIGVPFPITGGVFLHNTATTYGGGAFIDGSGSIRHGSFVGNTAGLGAAVSMGATSTFQDNFVAYHDTLAVDDSGDVVDHNGWFQNLPAPGRSAGTGTGDVTGDPEVSEPAAFSCNRGDLLPPVSSPLVGAASDGSTIGALDQTTVDTDLDGDGFSPPFDCNELDAAINPAATEICDGQDNDCDGLADAMDPDVTDADFWFEDSDGDGYGNENASAILSCLPVSGSVTTNDDCNDSNADINPAGTEVCNTIDDDCDGLTDDADPSVTGAATWYRDMDSDGFGTTGTTVQACMAPVGYVASSTDCNDGDPNIRPNAVETCNTVDDDCSGTIDDNEAQNTPWYPDLDGDGYGDNSSLVAACPAPPMHVGNAVDCDDSEATVFPGNPEICDQLDNDCNGMIDDNAPVQNWYLDTDGDGYGAGAAVQSCDQPIGYVLQNGDCGPSDNTVNPGAPELCDGVDHDCDGSNTAGAVDMSTKWNDLDDDGYGNPAAALTACTHPASYVDNPGDCNDQQPLAWGGAEEICDGVDNDCSGTVDGADATDALPWYPDLDNDQYGFGTPLVRCSQPQGYRANNLDCDDSDNSVHPGAPEQCDAIDHNCNGPTDDGVMTQTWYLDGDNDGYGTASSTTMNCLRPAGYAGAQGDCADTNPAVNPGVVDTCDGFDDNCSGDESDAVDRLPFFPDLDSDGWGENGAVVLACTPGPQDAERVGDCDDTNPNVNPEIPEVCDGIDNDCDGLADQFAIDLVLFYRDADGDGYGDAASQEAFCPGMAPSGWVGNNIDCNDLEPLAFGGAVEFCDGIDNDCDGLLDAEDDSVSGESSWYQDLDGDGHGDAQGPVVIACEDQPGLVNDATDCDDSEAAAWTDAPEICDGVDNDCDGLFDADDNDMASGSIEQWYPDEDGDGYGDDAGEVAACTPPDRHVDRGGDCDDDDETRSPGVVEVCGDGVDNDCDGETDEECAKVTRRTGCACDTPHTPAPWFLVAMAGALLGRRRRVSPRGSRSSAAPPRP
ncbi:MAG: MopE-related protein [Myxococcota bacterium]